MKRGRLEKVTLGLALACLPFFSGCLQQPALSSEAAPTVNPANTDLAYSPVSGPSEDPADVEQTPESQDVSSAPVTLVNPDKPLPENIKPTEALSELIRLAQSGVDAGVMEAFVTNSTSTFSLGSHEIIYLNDIGVPAQVISAMLQHDHLLITAAANPPPPPPFEPLPEPENYATPAEAPLTPAPDYARDYEPAPAPEVAAPEPDFYDALNPYGTWVDIGGYGRCWQPSVVVVNHDWQPYCDRGHWVYSDCGWYWQSDYSWGWAPFHYGRWFRHHNLGWCWQPDAVWGPSWVCWRSTAEFCGWAPLPPAACFRPGFGFTFFGRPVGFGCSFGLSATCFTFVPVRNFCDFRVSRFALEHHHVDKFFNSTTASTTIVTEHNMVVNHGISAERIAAANHSHIRPVPVRQLVSVDAPAAVAQHFEAGGSAFVGRSRPTAVPRTSSSFSEREASVARRATGSGAVANSAVRPAPARSPSFASTGNGAQVLPHPAPAPESTARVENPNRTTYRRWSGQPSTTSPALPNVRPETAPALNSRMSQGLATRESSSPNNTGFREPLIIRGPSRTAHSENSSADPRFARPNANSMNNSGNMAYRESPQHFWGWSGQPSRQATVPMNPTESSFRQRLENRAAAQSPPAREYYNSNARTYAAPAYQAPAESRHYSAPAYSPPASFSRNEPAPAPAPAPAHTSESHSAPASAPAAAPSHDHSSSGRGR